MAQRFNEISTRQASANDSVRQADLHAEEEARGELHNFELLAMFTS